MSTNSEEYLKVLTKLKWKIYLQNVKHNVKANMEIFALKNIFYIVFDMYFVIKCLLYFNVE